MAARRARKPVETALQPDLFLSPLKDVRFRDSQDTMVYPFFALTKQKRTKDILFTNPKTGEYVKITAPPEIGIATIYDADFLKWGLSTIRQTHDSGGPLADTVDFAPFDFWHPVRGHWESIGGNDYDRLEDMLRRLKSTEVETNLIRDGKREKHIFNWISELKITRNLKTERIERVRATFPKWLVDGYLNDQLILTIDDEYFQLKGALDRWLYGFLRKSVGKNTRWIAFRVDTLHKRSGTTRELKKFAYDLRELVAGYDPESDANKDKPRGDVPTFPRYRMRHQKTDGIEFFEARCIETVEAIAHKRPGEQNHRYKAGFLAVSDDVRDEARAMCKASGKPESELYEAWKASNQRRLTDGRAVPLKAPGRAYLGYVRNSLKPKKPTA